MNCSTEELHGFAAKLCLVEEPRSDQPSTIDRALLLEIIVSHAQRRRAQIDALNDMPLYPTEQVR
jgi:hypothetical protein